VGFPGASETAGAAAKYSDAGDMPDRIQCCIIQVNGCAVEIYFDGLIRILAPLRPEVLKDL
jgi:hypothetical protein